MKYINNFLQELLFITSEMAPYLLLGFLFAGILHVFVKKEIISKYLGKKNLKSVIYAALLGVPLPLCSCGVIPTGISFYRDGASKGAVVSFLISTPQTGVDSIMATYSLLGAPFAIIRPIVALISGIFGGGIENYMDKNEKTTDNIIDCEFKSESKKNNKLISMLKYSFIDLLQDIAKWLVIGLIIAALIAVLLPDDFFTQYIGNDILSMLIVLAASVPLYVCATGSVPIAAVLLMKGLSPGAALVFLMAGPATNAATITVIGKTLGKKTIMIYLFSIIISSILFGILIDNSFLRELINNSGMADMSAHSHFLPEWLKYGSTILLILLTINVVYRKNKYRFIKSATNKKNNMNEVLIIVNGMTCSHCKNSVESAIANLEGIDSASVNLDNSTLKISGKNIDLDIIKTEIEKLGYKFGGSIK
ncbi:permease [Bacteroidota bacterium]